MHFEESPLLQRPGNAGMELRKKEYDCATYQYCRSRSRNKAATVRLTFPPPDPAPLCDFCTLGDQVRHDCTL